MRYATSYGQKVALFFVIRNNGSGTLVPKNERIRVAFISFENQTMVSTHDLPATALGNAIWNYHAQHVGPQQVGKYVVFAGKTTPGPDSETRMRWTVLNIESEQIEFDEDIRVPFLD